MPIISFVRLNLCQVVSKQPIRETRDQPAQSIWLATEEISSLQSHHVRKPKPAIAKRRRSERGALPGVLLPVGRRGRSARRRRRGLAGLRCRAGAAGAAAPQRHRQPADAADTPPRHHCPSLNSELTTVAYLLQLQN